LKDWELISSLIHKKIRKFTATPSGAGALPLRNWNRGATLKAGVFVKAEAKAAVCPLCDDTGWKPAQEGRVTKCDCRLRARGATLEEVARIPRRYANCDISTFRYDMADVTPREHDALSHARLMASKFVEDYPIDRNGLLFVGPNGTGKTHLAVAIIKELIRTKNVPCLFCDYRELLKQIRNSYDSNVQATELDVLRPIFETEILVLDDLGAFSTTQWERDTVSYILNKRYSDERTTIVTTYLADKPTPNTEYAEQPSSGFGRNKNLDEARAALRERTLGERIGDQMRARLHEMCRKVEIHTRDFRDRQK
jgi:DNA replication protein DnaC